MVREAVQLTEAGQGDDIYGVNDTTARIGDVEHLISSIAEQTNLCRRGRQGLCGGRCRGEDGWRGRPPGPPPI